MINTYSFFESDVNRLNDFVLAFFNRIETETGNFSEAFFEKEFYDNLVKRHKGILLKSFKSIYEITKTWSQHQRTELCESIRRSNRIAEICDGTELPTRGIDIPIGIRDLLLTLFSKLYKNVLFGEFFKPYYGDRKTHYHDFREWDRNGYTNCPACGIVPMHTSLDDITDQYDHYLPKDIYPFSAVNFRNLVPVCTDCNSIAVKSNNDILLHTGSVFYPYDDAHQSIEFEISIQKNSTELKNIEWQIDYSCEVGKEDKLAAWKAIYKIESRHKNHVGGKIKAWYKQYWDYVNDPGTKEDLPDAGKRDRNYLKTKKSSPFERQCLTAYLAQEIPEIEQSTKASRYA